VARFAHGRHTAGKLPPSRSSERLHRAADPVRAQARLRTAGPMRCCASLPANAAAVRREEPLRRPEGLDGQSPPWLSLI
jgi:hypothetical protein